MQLDGRRYASVRTRFRTSAIDPDVARAVELDVAGRRTEATALARAVLQRTPSSVEARCVLATIALRDGSASTAGALLRQACVLEPSYPQVHYYLALWRPDRGDIPGMESSLARARQLLGTGSRMATSLEAFAGAWRWLSDRRVPSMPLRSTSRSSEPGSTRWLFVWRDLEEFLDHFDQAQVGGRSTFRLPKRDQGPSSDPSEQLLRYCKDVDPEIVVFLPGTAQHRNPTLGVFRQLRAQGIPTVLFVADLRKALWQGVANRVADAFDLVLPIDGCSLESLPSLRHLGRRFFRGWSPISPGNVPPFATRRSCVNLVGSLWGERVHGVQALRNAGIEVITRPSAIEAHRDPNLPAHKTLSTATYLDSLRQAQLTVNYSACSTGDGHQLKGRVLEAAACGSMLLESANDVTCDFFEEGREYVSFDGAADLVEKVRYFLAHPERAAEIAANATSRFLRDYTATTFWTRVLAAARENNASIESARRRLHP